VNKYFVGILNLWIALPTQKKHEIKMIPQYITKKQHQKQTTILNKTVVIFLLHIQWRIHIFGTRKNIHAEGIIIYF